VTDYIPIFVHLTLAVVLTVALLAVHALVGGRLSSSGPRRRPLPGQAEPYESGVWPVGSARERIPIRYYLIAMLFLLFDVEAVFLYPWAVIARELGVIGLIEILTFVAVLGLGFGYAWKRGALEWQ
jgi:NADH-quinone oxidoreductase subunit A